MTSVAAISSWRRITIIAIIKAPPANPQIDWASTFVAASAGSTLDMMEGMNTASTPPRKAIIVARMGKDEVMENLSLSTPGKICRRILIMVSFLSSIFTLPIFLPVDLRELDRLIACIEGICRDTRKVQIVCAGSLFLPLISAIGVGVDGIFAAASLFIYYTSENTRSGLRQQCFHLLEAFFFCSSRRRHTRSLCDWSSDVCASD